MIHCPDSTVFYATFYKGYSRKGNGRNRSSSLKIIVQSQPSRCERAGRRSCPKWSSYRDGFESGAQPSPRGSVMAAPQPSSQPLAADGLPVAIDQEIDKARYPPRLSRNWTQAGLGQQCLSLDRGTAATTTCGSESHARLLHPAWADRAASGLPLYVFASKACEQF